MQFYIIHQIDALSNLGKVSNYRKQFKGLPLVETECCGKDEHEYNYLFEERGETMHPTKIYHLKFAGVLNKEQLRNYIQRFDYLEVEGCQTMGSLTEYGLLADIPLHYFDYYQEISEDVRIAPMVNSEGQFNKVAKWIESQL